MAELSAGGGSRRRQGRGRLQAQPAGRPLPGKGARGPRRRPLGMRQAPQARHGHQDSRRLIHSHIMGYARAARGGSHTAQHRERLRGAQVHVGALRQTAALAAGLPPADAGRLAPGRGAAARQVPVAAAEPAATQRCRPATAAADAPGHVGLAGLHDSAAAPGPHAHFDLAPRRALLRLTDPRRFGAVVWSRAWTRRRRRAAGAPGRRALRSGADAALLHAACKRRKVAIKTLLLGGQVVVGAGNIYACEALFHAGIDPRTRCDRSACRAARACWPRCADAGARARARRLDAARLQRRARHGRRVPGRGPGLRPRRPALPALWRPVRRIVQGAALDLFLCQRR
jgi:formamidopyrimidine-DNA glycosylase